MHMHMRMHIEKYVHIKAHVRDKLLLDTCAKWCKALRLYLRFANTYTKVRRSGHITKSCQPATSTQAQGRTCARTGSPQLAPCSEAAASATVEAFSNRLPRKEKGTERFVILKAPCQCYMWLRRTLGGDNPCEPFTAGAARQQNVSCLHWRAHLMTESDAFHLGVEYALVKSGRQRDLFISPPAGNQEMRLLRSTVHIGWCDGAGRDGMLRRRARLQFLHLLCCLFPPRLHPSRELSFLLRPL